MFFKKKTFTSQLFAILRRCDMIRYDMIAVRFFSFAALYSSSSICVYASLKDSYA